MSAFGYNWDYLGQTDRPLFNMPYCIGHAWDDLEVPGINLQLSTYNFGQSSNLYLSQVCSRPGSPNTVPDFLLTGFYTGFKVCSRPAST